MGLKLGDTRVVTFTGTAANGGGFTPNRGTNRLLANVVFDKPVQLLYLTAKIIGTGDVSGNSVISNVTNYNVLVPSQSYTKPIPTVSGLLSLDPNYTFELPEGRLQAFPDLGIVEANISAYFKNNNGEDTTYDDCALSVFYAELLNL
jgi:hypothetical protein